MNFNYFINYLNQKFKLAPLSLLNELVSTVSEIHLKKGTHLLHAGEICKHLYFIQSGFFRVYESDGIEESTICFAGKDQFITVLESFLNQSPSPQAIVCESTGIVFKISHHDWLALEKSSPDFNLLTKRILLEHILLLQAENRIFRTRSSSSSFKYLTKKHPGITNIVSQKSIASYLGIQAPTLSNILKSMFANQK